MRRTRRRRGEAERIELVVDAHARARRRLVSAERERSRSASEVRCCSHLFLFLFLFFIIIGKRAAVVARRQCVVKPHKRAWQVAMAAAVHALGLTLADCAAEDLAEDSSVDETEAARTPVPSGNSGLFHGHAHVGHHRARSSIAPRSTTCAPRACHRLARSAAGCIRQ